MQKQIEELLEIEGVNEHEQGSAMREQRSIEAETVFGDIKYNMNFRSFMLRGLKKAEVEWGLVCLAHNLRKLAIQ